MKRLKIVLGWALVVVLTPVLILSWPSPVADAGGAGTLIVDKGPKALGPMSIVGVKSDLLWSANRIPVTSITVKNGSDAFVRAQSWWILAGVDDTKPWIDPTLESSHVEVDLTGGTSSTVAVPAPPNSDAKPGVYRLSLWVQVLDPVTGHWVHSDGRAMLGNVQVLPPRPGFVHAKDSSLDLWLDGVTVPATWVAGQPATVRADVANGSAHTKSIELWCFLAPPSVTEPWTDPDAVRSSTVTATSSPGSLVSLNIPLHQVPAAGQYRLSVWLHESTPSGSVHDDGVWLQQLITVAG